MAQHTQVGLCVPVGIQLENAEVGPTSGPTWRLSHLWVLVAVDQDEMCVVLGHVAFRRQAPLSVGRCLDHWKRVATVQR